MSSANHVNGDSGAGSRSLTNYIAYVPSNGVPRIGHLDRNSNTIQPLSFKSGTHIPDLYAVIEAGEENIISTGEDALPVSSIKLLAPISGRDVLAVGKNYSDHAVEFNSSGFDSSDKVDQPTHPVIFTKRATSIIAHGEEILPHHPEFTETVDYEGELGVIIGKAGFRIAVADAMNYVWGYTIINDMTARERQRDHKQFYIGKSPDTFCPMGPIAVPKESMPSGPLRVQTSVNGVEKQNATTEQLIFSIPFLVKTLSEGQTLSPGDVIATGTPAGVGIGKKPPVYLKSGDLVEVSVTGLGTLSNRIASASSPNFTIDRVKAASHIPIANVAKSHGKGILTPINGKNLFYQKKGIDNGSPIVFVHGLGGSNEFFTPLLSLLQLEQSHALHLFDLEGHGLSPSGALSILSISSFSEDLKGVFDHAGLSGSSGTTLVAHSMGCLVALDFAIKHPELVQKLVLLGPPPNPLPEAGSKGSYARAAAVREKGMPAVADAVATAGTSERTKTENPHNLSVVKLSLLGQNPEGYAKACTALAGATERLSLDKVTARTFILTGNEDKVSPPDLCKSLKSSLSRCEDPVVLDHVGHWHIFEDPRGVAEALRKFIL